MQTWRMNLWTEQGRERVGQTERVALKHTFSFVKYLANGKSLYRTGSSIWSSVTT